MRGSSPSNSGISSSVGTTSAPGPSILRLIAYKSKCACSKLSASRYFKANIVYLLYGIIMIIMDVYTFSPQFESKVYLALAIIHALNAYMYLWVWKGEHQNIYSLFCVPDWLNVVCAAFYLCTGFMGPFEYDSNGRKTDIFVKVRRIELFLSILEAIATVGWLLQWYIEFRKDLLSNPKKCRGRGFTFDDPDCWANISIVVAATYYFVYNIVICYDNYAYYEISQLYYYGDLWYLINAICYIICSLRDSDCFWFMPLSGHFPDFHKMAEELAESEVNGSQRDVESFAIILSPPPAGLVTRVKPSHTQADPGIVSDKLHHSIIENTSVTNSLSSDRQTQGASSDEDGDDKAPLLAKSSNKHT